MISKDTVISFELTLCYEPLTIYTQALESLAEAFMKVSDSK